MTLRQNRDTIAFPNPGRPERCQNTPHPKCKIAIGDPLSRRYHRCRVGRPSNDFEKPIVQPSRRRRITRCLWQHNLPPTPRFPDYVATVHLWVSKCGLKQIALEREEELHPIFSQERTIVECARGQHVVVFGPH